MTNKAIKLKNKKIDYRGFILKPRVNNAETKSLDILSAFKHARDSLRSLTQQLKCDFEKRLADNIKTDLDLGNPVDVAYFDFRKAYNSVPHIQLMLGIRGNLLKWIEDFLVDHQQKVILCNEKSD